MPRSILPVLLAGGSGTRLWPLSRELYPKQFLRLTGEHSLLQETALRARRIPGAQPPVVISGDPHRFLVAEQLREAGIAEATIILEPEGRGTAPAATIAALHARQTSGDDTLVFLMSADHAVADVPAFAKAVERAAAAADGRLVVFGIRPTRPETGYGYLKAGKPLGDGAFELDRFVEKPDAPTAQRLIADARHSWNGGLFLFPAGILLEEMQRLEPGTLAACEAALRGARRDLDFVRLDATAFSGARNDSIDYAVMEKTRRAALVPLDAGWDDVGTWEFLRQAPDADAAGNVTRGDVIAEDMQGSLIHASSRLVAALGLKDQLVVETPDAVLVAPRDRAQDIKSLVQRLRKAGRIEAESHRRVFRPWGSYETVAEGPGFQVKRLRVKAGQKLSLQMHHRRAEHWVVVRGTAEVTCGDREFKLSANESTYIPLGQKHRLGNPGPDELEVIEVQSGDYLGEDDIVRFEDRYGRA